MQQKTADVKETMGALCHAIVDTLESPLSLKVDGLLLQLEQGSPLKGTWNGVAIELDADGSGFWTSAEEDQYEVGDEETIIVMLVNEFGFVKKDHQHFI